VGPYARGRSLVLQGVAAFRRDVRAKPRDVHSAAFAASHAASPHIAVPVAMIRDDDFRVRPGRIRSRGSQRGRPAIAQALAAAQRAGGIGSGRAR
jgi:hypothetical protein